MESRKLAEYVRASKRIEWISGSEKPVCVPVPELWTVKECFDIPEPDTTWRMNRQNENNSSIGYQRSF